MHAYNMYQPSPTRNICACAETPPLCSSAPPPQVADSDLCLGQPSGGATAGVLGHAISNYARIADNRDAVAFTVAYYGPVVFSFRVVDSFRYYSGGIYSSSW